MKKISIKKVVSWFLIFTMVLVLKPVNVTATGDSGVVVQSAGVNPSTNIYKGTEFTLDITLQNITGDQANSVLIEIVPSSFSSTKGGNVILFGNIAPGTSSIEKRIYLKYNGGEDTDFKFNIRSSQGITTAQYVSIHEAYTDSAPTQKVDTTKYVPKLSINNPSAISIKAGTSSTFNLNLKNNSNYTAKDVIVTPTISEPFEIASTTSSKSVGDINSKKEISFNYTLKVKGSAQEQTYPIALKYSFSNAYGDSFEATETIYIKVTKSSLNVDLGVNNATTVPSDIKAGENFVLSLDIQNDGNDFAKNVSVSLVGLSSEGFALVSGRNIQTIPLVLANNKKTVTFNLNADTKIKSGNQMLKAKLVYTDSNDDKKTEEQEFYLKVTAGDTSSLSIENMVYPTQQLVPGETFTVAFDVANNGSGVAEHITVATDGGENIIPKSQSTQLISKIAPNSSKTVYFKFQPQDKLVAKSYLINIEVKNGKNEVVQSMKQYVGVEVGQKSDIIIGAIAQSAYVIKPNEEFTVSFPITNSGIGITKNIKVSINGGDAILTKSGSTNLIPSLGAGKTQNITFKLQASKGAETKNYPIGIEVKYDGSGENTIKDNTSIYVEKNASANEKGVPRIIINKYSVDPVIVKAGSNFELELSFLNTNFAKEVKNIKVYLTVDEKSSKTGNVFTPVNSSNTFFIDAISPKQIANKKITLYTIPDASAKTYTITANLEYEDANGTEYKAQELIGIAVSQPSKLKVGDIQMPPEVFVGQPTTISAEFYNVGKVALSNFMVRAEGNFTIQKANYFVGNFDIGGSDTYEVEITPNAPGDLKGFVIFSYDEPNGEHVEIKKIIAAQVTEMPPVEANPGDMVPLEGNKSSKWIKIIAVVVLLGAGVVGRIVYKKIKEKKEEAGLSADE